MTSSDLLPLPCDFVEPKSGDVEIERVDLELDASPGLRVSRRYCSRDAEVAGLLGPGWLTPFDARVVTEGEELRVIDRRSRVHRVRLRGRALDGLRVSPEGPTLHRTSTGLELRYHDGGRDLLVPHGAGALLAHRVGGDAAPCTVSRDARGVIVRIDTPLGAIEVARTASEVTLRLVVRREVTWWRRYRLASGTLVGVEDVQGPCDEYEHDGALVVGVRERGQPWRYFEHEGRAPGSRCVRTWAEDGALDHAYTRLATGRVLVEDTRGDAWQLVWDEGGLVRIDPTGAAIRVPRTSPPGE